MTQLPEDKRLQFVPQEERPPMSPQLALRVAMVGTFALAIFAILFFRLWFLQVLSSDHYAKAASVNFVRPVEVAAPRGQILVVVLVNTLIALPVYALIRRIIRPVLPEDPRRRRRRAYTTGGLSPLHQGAARRGLTTRTSAR